MALRRLAQQQLVGARTVIDMLDPQQPVLDSEVAQVLAERDVLAATLQVLGAVGRLDAQHLALNVPIYDPPGHFDAVHEQWIGTAPPSAGAWRAPRWGAAARRPGCLRPGPASGTPRLVTIRQACSAMLGGAAGRDAARRDEGVCCSMSGSVGLPAIPSYVTITKNETQYATKFAKTDPQTAAALAYFQKTASALTTPDALLKNYRALQVVLGAFNMSDQIGNTAILKKLMTQDPTSSSSLAQQMANPDYLRFAKAMSTWNPPPFSDASNVSAVVSGYTNTQYEQSEGNQIPGMQQALYFTRMIGSVKTVPQLMSDSNLLNVVLNGLNLPQQFGLLDYDQQVQILTKAVDFSKFSDPKFVSGYAEKYLISQAGTSSGSQAPSILTAFGDASGNDLLSTLAGAPSGVMMSFTV